MYMCGLMSFPHLAKMLHAQKSRLKIKKGRYLPAILCILGAFLVTFLNNFVCYLDVHSYILSRRSVQA